MERASNAPENSSRPENIPTSSQPRNRPSNSAAGSSSRHSEMNRLLDSLAKDVEYRNGDGMSSPGVPHRPWIMIGTMFKSYSLLTPGQRSRENSLTPSARRGATPTPPAQSASKYRKHTHCHYHCICICVPFSKYARRSPKYNMLTARNRRSKLEIPWRSGGDW
jgi:hypothetical protein